MQNGWPGLEDAWPLHEASRTASSSTAGVYGELELYPGLVRHPRPKAASFYESKFCSTPLWADVPAAARHVFRNYRKRRYPDLAHLRSITVSDHTRYVCCIAASTEPNGQLVVPPISSLNFTSSRRETV
jgi:hypothetical protein